MPGRTGKSVDYGESGVSQGGLVTEGTALRKLLTIASTKGKVEGTCHQLMSGSRRCWEALIKADPLTLPAVA